MYALLLAVSTPYLLQDVQGIAIDYGDGGRSMDRCLAWGPWLRRASTMPAMGCDWFVGIRTRHLLTSVDRDVWAACRSALRLSLTHTHSRLSLSSGFLQRLRLRMRGRRRRRDHTGGKRGRGDRTRVPLSTSTSSLPCPYKWTSAPVRTLPGLR